MYDYKGCATTVAAMIEMLHSAQRHLPALFSETVYSVQQENRDHSSQREGDVLKENEIMYAR